MSKSPILKRLEEALARRKQRQQAEKDHELHQELIKRHCSFPGHKKPVTRRDFLEVGVLSFSGMMLGPSFHTILSKLTPAAYAQVTGQDCPAPETSAANGPVPFVNLHLEGGFQTLSSVTPRMTNGARLDSYTRLGLGANPDFVNNVFANGAELFDNGNNLGFYRGLLAGAQATTLSNAALVTVPVRDNGDDTGQPFSILGLVERAGRAGSKLAFLRNGGTTTTGIAGRAAFNIVTSVNPTSIRTTNDILNSVQLTGALSRLTQQQQMALARTIQSLNTAQASRITGLNGGQELAKLVYCATEQNIKNVEGGGAEINPRNINGMAQIWGNFGTDRGNGTGSFNNDAIAAMVVNVLNGNAAGCAINIGGFDIHAGPGTRQDQEVGAFNIGRTVGRILESARQLNTKVFIHITTNGGNVNAGGTPTSLFNNDDSSGNCFGGSHFIMYDPAAPVQTTSNLPQQIGGLTATGNVDRNVFTSNVADGEAAVFYNYCVFSGMESEFDKVMSSLRSYTVAQKQFMRKKA